MKFEPFTFLVTGTRPVLMNNPAGMAVPTGKPKGRRQKEIPSPEEEAARSVYKLPSGQLYGPAAGLRRAIIDAAYGLKFGKVKADELVASAVFNLEEEALLFHPRTKKPVTSYVIDTRRCVIPSNKAGVVRSRAKVMEWATLLNLEIDTDTLEVEQIAELLERAGRLIGWMDFRIQKKGPFGAFIPELVAAAKAKKKAG